MSKTSPTFSPLVLTDTQRQLCLAALARPDGAIIMAARLKGRPAVRVAEALIGKSLVREVRSKAELPVWRHDATTGHRFSLVLTKAARALLAADDAAALQGQAPEGAAAAAPDGATIASPETAATPLPSEVGGHGAAAADRANPPASTEPSSPRAGSKLSGVLTLLGRDSGTTVADIMAATGWLPHTTRAALTGLRKRGYPVQRVAGSDGAGSVYRIGGAAVAAAA